MRSTFALCLRVCAFSALAGTLTLGACYRGGEREKEPPVGYPGGFCLAPNATCHDGACDVQGGAYCYDPTDPCRGIFCGGHGACLPNAEGKPTCMCEPGYGNATYSLFCMLGDTADGGGDDGMDTGMALPDMGG